MMMTSEEVLEMAEQAGMVVVNDKFSLLPFLEAFAKLVRNDYSNKHAQLWLKRIDDAIQAEREACAKVCEELSKTEWADNERCAKAIRARGEAT